MSSRGRLSVRESASSSGEGTTTASSSGEGTTSLGERRNAAETTGITNLGTGTQKGTGTQTGTEIRMLQAAARAGAGAEAGPQEMRADKTEGSGGEAAAGAEADTEAGHTGTGAGNEAAAGTVLAARRVVAPENGGGSTAVADARRPHILAATYTVAKARFAVPLPAGDDHSTSVVERYQCHTHTPTHTPAQTHVHAFAYIHTHTQVRVAHGSVGVGGEACSAAAVLCSRVMARLSGEQRRGHRVRA